MPGESKVLPEMGRGEIINNVKERSDDQSQTNQGSMQAKIGGGGGGSSRRRSSRSKGNKCTQRNNENFFENNPISSLLSKIAASYYSDFARKRGRKNIKSVKERSNDHSQTNQGKNQASKY